ncbi:MBL fold metallo-hydrolase [Dietzia sp. B19]|uniref:MBL fold metallo-hydrolase n=1 Tax=Dietzia sp. B19 TaxID=1630632 RepID=UPI0015F9E0D9|nr:MBL fold metallo-hydrolase [Dietzia sp. B19]
MTHEFHTTRVSDAIRVYQQPPGTWGLGNATLVLGSRSSLLIDTLNDVVGTDRMLSEFASLTADAPVSVIVNTSGDSDHTGGNQLFSELEIISAAGAADLVRESDPSAMAQVRRISSLMPSDMKVMMRLLTEGFEFGDIVPTPAGKVLAGDLTVDVSGRRADILDLGAARSGGDAAVWIPEDRAIVAGDLVASGVIPLAGETPSAWLEALDRLAGLNAEVVIPGHGPIGGPELIDVTREYVELLHELVRRALENDSKPKKVISAVATDFLASRFSDWQAPERVAANVHHAWAAIDPTHKMPSPPVLISHMGWVLGKHFTDR